MNDTTRLAVTQGAGAVLIAAAIVWGALEISEALRGAVVSPKVPAAPTSPVSARKFSEQWQAHYAPVAEESCWRPFDAQYARLPGHLDLGLEVGADGVVSRVELLGYTNPGDNPDPLLTQQVFACVSEILEEARFPAFENDYRVEGRVNRPAPPSPSGGRPADRPEGSLSEAGSQVE